MKIAIILITAFISIFLGYAVYETIYKIIRAIVNKIQNTFFIGMSVEELYDLFYNPLSLVFIMPIFGFLIWLGGCYFIDPELFWAIAEKALYIGIGIGWIIIFRIIYAIIKFGFRVLKYVLFFTIAGFLIVGIFGFMFS